MYSLSGMLLKEPRQGNVQKIADAIYSHQQKFPGRCKIKNVETKTPTERENQMNSLSEACRAYWKLRILRRRSYQLH